MENKNTAIRSVIIVASIMLLSACAGKMNVAETPAEEATAETTEPAAAPAEAAAEETKETDKVVEVIPLDGSAESATEAGTDTRQAPAENAEAAAPSQETVPLDVTGIIARFLDHRNTLWHSRDRTYRLYVGDQFESEYSPENKTFTIMSDVAGSDLECKYNSEGKLDPQESGQKKECNALVTKLENYVSNF